MPDLSPATSAWRTALLESSLDCVIIMAGDGVIVDLNRGTEETFGVSRQAVVGRRLGDVFVPPELRGSHEAGLQRYLATGQSAILGTRVEVEAMHSSGRRIPVELSIVRLAGVSPPLFVGHLQDISGRLRTERRLRLNAVVSGVLATSRSPESAVRSVLQAISEELQWPVVQFWRVDAPRQRLRLDASSIRPDLDTTAFQSQTTFAKGEGLPGETWRRDQPIWIDNIRAAAATLPRFDELEAAGVRSALSFPVHVEGQTVAIVEAFRNDPEPHEPELLALLSAIGGQLGHVIAVHEARQALQEAAQRANDARESAERANIAKDEFLAIISHELRTPLGPILGWAQLLMRDEVDKDTRIKAAGSILRNGELESQLVEDLLDVSRMVQGKLTIERVPVSLVHVIHASIETAAPAARAGGIELRFEGDFDVPPIVGDPKRLQQVVSNLLNNSIKFTPSGGRIDVSVAVQPAAIELTIRDTGEGIEPQLLPYIFDRFRQGQHGGEGSSGLGLGLAIVRQLVHGHGGTVEASSPGRGLGATFTVRLPRPTS